MEQPAAPPTAEPNGSCMTWNLRAGRIRHEAADHRLFGTLFRERVNRESLGWEK